MALTPKQAKELNALYLKIEATSKRISDQESKGGKAHSATLKSMEKTQGKILELEKNISTLSKGQVKVVEKSASLSAKAGKEMEKQKSSAANLFGLADKTGQLQKESVENISTIVQSNEDLSQLGGEQLTQIDMINAGYFSQEDLAAKVAHFEGKIADETGNVSDAQKDIYKQTLAVAKNRQKSYGLAEKTKKAVKDTAKSMGKMVMSGLSLGGAMALVTKALQQANQIVGSVGKEFGALGMTNEAFSNRVNQTVPGMMKLGLSADDLNSSITMLTSEFGQNINQIDAAGGGIEVMAMRIADSGKAMGLNTQEATKLFGTVMKITDLSAEQTENLLEQTASLAMQSGVAPQVVMRDIANSGELFASHMKDGGKNVLEAAIRARQLGLDLNAVAKIGDTLMNYQSSLNAEMEASIMIGRQINLQKARELYLAGDLSGMQDEILKQVGSEQKFNNMNIMQKQALAKAVGMNVQELQKMMSAEKDMAEMNGELQETNPFKDMIGEDTLTAIDELTNKFNAVLAQVGVDLIPTFDGLVESLSGVMDTLVNGIGVANMFGIAMGAMIAPSLAAAAGSIAAAMGATALAAPVIGWGIAAAGALATWGIISSMMSEAKTIKDGGSMGGGYVMSRPEGNVQLTRGDDFVAGTNLFGDKGGSTAALSPQALKRERREERQLELAERQAKIEEEKLKILKDTADASIGTYRELYQT